MYVAKLDNQNNNRAAFSIVLDSRVVFCRRGICSGCGQAEGIKYYRPFFIRRAEPEIEGIKWEKGQVEFF